MTTTSTSLTRKPQSINCKPETREKAKRLDILMLTSTYALVQGDSDIHQVWIETLECSCKAADFDLRCSHAMAVVLRLAQREEATAMFAHSVKHAASWARLQESKGRTARVDEVAGYAVCVSGKPSLAPAQPTRPFADVTAAANDALFGGM